MIKIIESPMRADVSFSYEVADDVLTVTLDDVAETFDFTGMPEGFAESIEVDELRINPIVSAKKVGDEVEVVLIRFYTREEKELFETGEPVENIVGGVDIG